MSERENYHQMDILEGTKVGVAFILVCAAMFLILMGVNAATDAAAAQQAEERRAARFQTVMPGAESFSDVWFDHSLAKEVLAAFSGSELKGYCVTVSSHGFGGEMELLVGVDVNGRVTGISVLSHSETMEISQEERQSYLDQFLGMSGTIGVSDGGSNSVEGISGATMSSRAIADGVNAALAAVASLGGGEPGEQGTV